MRPIKYALAFPIYMIVTSATNSSGSVTIKFPSTAPGNAFHVPPTFLGLSIDEQSLLQYSGNSSNPNTFSQNLIENLNNRTGSYNTIRIGGTYGDRVVYNASQTDLPVNSGPEKPGWSVGPGFFEGYQQFPGNKITIQMRLGETQDLNNSVAFMQQAYKSVGADNLDAVEIGNEVDAYALHINYTPAKYVSDFLRYEKALESNLTSLPEGPIYQGCDTASLAAALGKWQPEEELNLGLNNNSRIKTMGVHYYQDKLNGSSLQDILMNHQAIIDRFENYTRSINYTRQQNLSYVLSEVGNSLEGKANLTFQAVLGSALWSVDFQMYAMTLGVERVNMAMKPIGGFSLWLPHETDGYLPAVRAPYYAQPYIADFMGKTGAQVLNQDLKSKRLSAYAAYDQGRLARIALVNLNLWNGTDQSERPVQTFNVQANVDQNCVQVRRLTAPTGAYANDTITWAGQQWTYESNGMSVTTNQTLSEPVPVQNGVAQVDVAASEAVMVML